MDDDNEKVKASSKKRLRKSKSLEFLEWGSKNLIDFLESLGKDTTNKISEYDVTDIVRKYIRDQNLAANLSNKTKKKTKIVACDMKLRLLFECEKINMIKLNDLVAKHYVENQDDVSYYCGLGDDEQLVFSRSEKRVKQTEQVVRKPKGTIAAIVRDNIKLLYLRKSLVQELAKTPEIFEGKVMGTFVRIKNPCQLVQVTGVKEGNLIDGHFLQVTNYCSYLKDVPSSALSDDDFSQEECEELRERIKNGCVKRLTVVDMEEKARSLHEDVTKHWLARELVLLQRKINQASEKGWRRELSQYLDKRELLSNPEEQSRLLLEVPEVVAEELVPERVDDDVDIENDFMEPNPEASIDAHQNDKKQQLSNSPVVQKGLEISELCDEEERSRLLLEVPEAVAEELVPECVDDVVDIENDFMEPNPEASIDAHQNDEIQQLSVSPVSHVQKALEISELPDEEDQPSPTASAGDKDVHEDVEEQPANDIITQNNKDSIYDKPQSQSNPLEIIELSDDEEEDNDYGAYEQCDPEKVMWCYELPKGKTNGPYSLTQLKQWSDQEYFVEVPDLKVWMTGNSIKSAVQSAAFEMPGQAGTREDESGGWKQVDETPTKHVKFPEPFSKPVMDDAEGQSDTKNRTYVPVFDDPSSTSSPLLSPVLEEQLSTAGDDDPLPAIEDLQISGEPYPGHELQACGFSINGTTSCNFEWVCHLEDGSVNYIDGAKQPNYLVTADDVDLYLATEVQPLDDRNRKGELVKVFANENRKIVCHPEMQSHIENNLHSGHVSYKVSLATGFIDIWEEATLSIKKEGYSIKCNNDIMVAEKFSSSTAVTIPFGQSAEFVIIDSDGSEHSLRADNGSGDLSCSRDAIVLTLRLFLMRALQRKKAKKRGFLFNK